MPEQRFNLAFARAMQLHAALDVPPLTELHDRIWRHDLGDGWRLVANGNREAVDAIPGYHIAVFRHDLPVVVCGPYHGITVGGETNEESFIARVEGHLRALGHEPWETGDTDEQKARAEA